MMPAFFYKFPLYFLSYSGHRGHLLFWLLCICGAAVPKVAYALDCENVGAERLLFLGNSITVHAPAAKLQWSGNWGMAATNEKYDYVHLISREITEKSGQTAAVLAINITAFERNIKSYDLKSDIDAAAAFRPTRLVIVIGENVALFSNNEEEKDFEKRLTSFVRMLSARTKAKIYIVSSFWPTAVDRALQDVAEHENATFIDISQIAKNPYAKAGAERKNLLPGVAAHPGNTGMALIARKILKGFGC